MTTAPEDSIDSTSATTPDLTIFPFLKKCYVKGFFNQFINNYFLFLLEDSHRLQWKADETFDNFLEMVFNPGLIDSKCYSKYFLDIFIYDGPQMDTQSNELRIIDSSDRFLLSSKYTRLKQLKFDKEQMKNELFRQAGLLVIHTRMNIRKPTQPQFIVTSKNGVSFCDTGIIKNSLLKYKEECSNALERADKHKIFGRIYTPIVTEYFGFIDFAIKIFHNLLTHELKDILNKWYQQHKQGKIDAVQDIGEGLPSTPGPLYYLQGRPSGSAPKK